MISDIMVLTILAATWLAVLVLEAKYILKIKKKIVLLRSIWIQNGEEVFEIDWTGFGQHNLMSIMRDTKYDKYAEIAEIKKEVRLIVKMMRFVMMIVLAIILTLITLFSLLFVIAYIRDRFNL